MTFGLLDEEEDIISLNMTDLKDIE